MSLWNTLGAIVGGKSGLLGSISETVDKFITTDKERDQAKRELLEIYFKAQNDQEQQLTERLKADMQSDSWLSKNIRPLTLIFLLLTFVGLTIFKAPELYINICRGWGELALMFYFGSRGVEKVAATFYPEGKGEKPKKQ